MGFLFAKIDMEKLKQYKYIILIALIILGFAFYWSEFRPYLIKKTCFKEALPTYDNNSAYNNLTRWGVSEKTYALCLKRNGI